MARIDIAAGDPAKQSNTIIVDTDTFVQIKIQNVSAVDVYVSENSARLNNVTPVSFLPRVGLIYPGGLLTIDIWDKFIGKLYARSQNAGAQLEVITNAIC